MTWFKIDDSFYDHPKVFDAPDCAVALWTRAGTWSARNLTDGFVPSGMPARLCDDPDTAVKELVRRGLWLRTAGGYRFHDWDEYQPSREAVEDLRAKRAEAGRKGGRAKAARTKVDNEMVTGADFGSLGRRHPDGAVHDAGQFVTSGSVATSKQTSSNGLASASGFGKQNAAPARPDPSFSGGGSPTAHGGTRAGAREEPPARCPKHLDDPDPPACGGCAGARKDHERWQRERQNHLAGLAAGPRCDRHQGQPAHNCALCRAERLGGDA